MTALEVRAAHVSGHWSARARTNARHIAGVVEDLELDEFRGTEMQWPGTLRAVRKALPGWAVSRRGEYLIGFREAAFEPVAPMELRRLTSTPRIALWRQLWVAHRVAIHIASGRRYRAEVGHCPAGVESGDRWKPGPQAVTARDGIAKWGRRGWRWHAVNPERRTLVRSLDSNLDQRRGVWLVWLTATLGGASIWPGRMPDRGSHGFRLIDTAHVLGGDVEDAGVLADKPKRYDHKTIWWATRLTPIKEAA